uniref:K Homology domain-containing protein n=1 Tax=Meloidogyne floridensis TaxID=298350 RepID=A0A915NP05_9BILA
MNDYKIYEEIIIPTKIADYIIEKISSKVFLKWKEFGCKIEPRAESKAIWIIMNGTEDENDDRFEKIFKILKFAEEANENEKLRFKISTRILIPNQKCGYVVGRNGSTLKRIVNDFNVIALMDGGHSDPVPEGFGRLILKGTKLDGIRSARLQINYMVKIALDLNPYGPADGKRISALGKTALAEERIKVPLFSAFSEEQKKQFREIQRTSKVDFIVDKEDKPQDGRYLVLKGELANVVETKKRISKLIFDLRYSPVEEEKTSPPTTTFLSSLDDQTTTFPSIDFVVPYPNFLGVLGQRGERIKSLRTELDVNLVFLGDNKAQYNEGRTLRITGKTDKKVQLAKLFIQREFIEKWSPKYTNNLIYVDLDRRRRVDNTGNDWGKFVEDSQMEVLVPQEIAKIMIKIKIKFGLTSYQLHRPRPDGFQFVCLKGSNEALEKASKHLDLMTAEYLKENGDGSVDNGEMNWSEESEGLNGDEESGNEEVNIFMNGNEERNKWEEEGRDEEEKENKEDKKKREEDRVSGGSEESKGWEEEKSEEENKNEGGGGKDDEKENEDKEDDEFEWRSLVNINEVIEKEDEVEEDDDDQSTLGGDFNNETRESFTSEGEEAIRRLSINSSFDEDKRKKNKKDEETKTKKNKEEKMEEKMNSLFKDANEKRKDRYILMMDDFLEQMSKREEAKDREISLLRRQNQRLKNKIFELEIAQSVTVNKRTQKRGKRYNTRKK